MSETTSKRRVVPRVSYTNFKRLYPEHYKVFRHWFAVSRYWGGRLINVTVKHHQVTFDFRRDWLADMRAR